MKFTEKISLETFGDKQFRIKLIEPENNQEAVLTHYLQSLNNKKISKFFKDDAINFTREILEHQYPEPENIITNKVAEEALQMGLFEMLEVPFPPVKKPKFTFIDLFAGIGGFRLALQNLGGKCVFTSEWDKFAKITYRENFGEVPFGDITKETTKSYVPYTFDVLCGGFPCQPFSHAGLKKGFEDTRGTLFFDVAEIISQRREANQPIKVIFLENVRGLKNHDKGNTLRTIVRTLGDLGYEVKTEVLNSKNFGIPQNRARLFIVAWLKDLNKNFKFPLGLDEDFNIIFKEENLKNTRETSVSDILIENVDPRFTISDRLFAGHLRRREEHARKGNGFGFSSFNENSSYTSTISARYYKDGSEILIEQEDANPRKLTPREAANLQGYPENFIIPVSDNQAYKQFGNSVSVPVIQTIFREIQNQLM